MVKTPVGSCCFKVLEKCDVVEGNFGIPDPMMLRYDATNHGNRGVSEQNPGWLMTIV